MPTLVVGMLNLRCASGEHGIYESVFVNRSLTFYRSFFRFEAGWGRPRVEWAQASIRDRRQGAVTMTKQYKAAPPFTRTWSAEEAAIMP